MTLSLQFKSFTGFTLAELLICVLILGEIATFTIPKIITSQQNGSHNAKAKEVMGMISEAYQKYWAANGFSVPSNASVSSLTPYFNYVNVDSTSTVDVGPGSGSLSCSTATWRCLRLHNGGILSYRTDINLGGTGTSHALSFSFDPDSTYSGSAATNAPGQGIEITLYYDGKLRTASTKLVPTSRSDGTDYSLGSEPSWFSW